MHRRGLCCLFVLALAGALRAEDIPAEQALALRDAGIARRRVDQLLRFLENKSESARLAQFFDEHEKAAAAAVEYLFDDKRYAVPEKARRGWVAGKDTQPGHDEMERLVGTAVLKHNELSIALCRALRALPELAGEARPTTQAWGEKPPKVATYGLCGATQLFDHFLMQFGREYGNYLKKREAMALAKAADTPATQDRTLYQALGALAKSEYRQARSAAAGLSGLEAHLFRQASAWHALAWNAANPQGRSAQEVSAIRVLNHYRIAIGLHPLVHSETLQKVSADFAQEMTRLKFMDHVHPKDATRKTMSDRGKRLGYPDICGECLSGSAQGDKEIWEWRSDAGHHRIMVLREATEIGLSYAGKGVLNVGWGAESPISVLFARRSGFVSPDDRVGDITDQKTNPFAVPE